MISRARLIAGVVGGAFLLAGGAAAAVPLNAAATAGAGTTRQPQAAPLGDGTAGYCPDKNGVTVVVDFNQLGGGIVVRCAVGPLGSDYTGLDALQDAGFRPEGTVRWGMQFICRIAGKPAADQKLHIKGNPNYKEKCVDTPPAQAFWSYWYAPNGGTWTLSAEGPASRDVIQGGFEGWSFSLNHTQDTAPPPGIDPQRPHQPPPTTPPSSTPPTTPPTSPPHSRPPTTRPTHGRGGGGASGGSRGSGGGSAPGTPTTPPSTSAPSGSTPPPSSKPIAHRDHRGSSSAARSTSRLQGSVASVSATRNPLAVGHNAQGEKVTGELPASASRDRSGSPTAAVAGILVLAVLAAGGYVAYRRRRTDTG